MECGFFGSRGKEAGAGEGVFADGVQAAALGLSTSGSGAVRVRTTPLLTVEDVDNALEVRTEYRAPGE